MRNLPQPVHLFLILSFSLVSFKPVSDKTNALQKQNIDHINTNIEIIKNKLIFENDSILNLAKHTRKLSQKMKYSNGESESYFYIAEIFRLRNMNDSAIFYYDQGINHTYNNPELKTEFYWSLANLYRVTGNYSSSLEAGLNAKKIIESQPDSKYRYKIYNLLGLSYQALMEYKLAGLNFQKALAMALESENESYAGVIYSNIGRLLYEQDSLNKALEYYDTGVQLEEKYKLYGSAGNSYTILARIYMKKTMPDSAKKYLLKATDLNKKSNNKTGLTHTLMSIGEYYFTRDSLDVALDHVQLTMKYANELNIRNILSQAYHLQAKIYAKQKEYKKAYESFEKFYEINNLLYNVAEINKAKAIEQRLIQQEKETEVYEFKLKKQKVINILLISIVSLAVIFGLIAIIYLVKFKKLNTELQNSKNKAEESDKLKSKFLQTISHEIRTPLNGIVGFSEMIRSKELRKSELDQINSMINKNTDDLISTIENLVDIAHLSTNQYNVKKTSVHIVSLLENIMIRAQENPVYKTKENLKLIFHKDEDVVINTDKNIISKILLHLVKNAILYTNKGAITVGYQKDKSSVIFYVKDTGIGIPQEKIDAIFTPFTQGNEDISIKVGGTGLGLTIVNGLIKILNGKIWVGSELKKGSTFYISLPIE